MLANTKIWFTLDSLSQPNIDSLIAFFDRLSNGESFLLLTGENPRPLLARLQKERTGSFSWRLLQGGPERYQVEVGRRLAGDGQSVGHFLWEEHLLNASALRDLRLALQENRLVDAERLFERASSLMLQHMEVEEQILLPKFEELAGASGMEFSNGLREEHVDIRKQLDAIHVALSRGVNPLGMLLDFQKLIEQHESREERTLYPAVDLMAGAVVVEDLVGRMRRRVIPKTEAPLAPVAG